MVSQQQDMPVASRPAAGGPLPGGRKAPELPVHLVPFQGEVPERLAAFFGRLNPWTWRDLRTVICRHPQTRRLVNIVRTIDLVLEKAPQTLARGHWSIAGYREALEKFESAIMRLGHLAGLVAGDARVRLPFVVQERRASTAPRPSKPGNRAPALEAGVHDLNRWGGLKPPLGRLEAA